MGFETILLVTRLDVEIPFSSCIAFLIVCFRGTVVCLYRM